MRFVISMRKWLRGEGPEKSSLHRESDHKECCVGQCLRQIGIPLSAIRGTAAASAVPGCPQKFEWWDNWGDIHTSTYFINDNEHTTDAEKQSALRKLFKKHGHSIVFRK